VTLLHSNISNVLIHRAAAIHKRGPWAMWSRLPRMNPTALEQAQSNMRREHQPQAVAERFGPAAVSDIMTLEEACAYLRISRGQAYDLTRNRGRVRQVHPIPVLRYGRSMKFRKASLDKWLERLEKQAG
jgi:excisionase family DNA binding protein